MTREEKKARALEIMKEGSRKVDARVEKLLTPQSKLGTQCFIEILRMAVNTAHEKLMEDKIEVGVSSPALALRFLADDYVECLQRCVAEELLPPKEIRPLEAIGESRYVKVDPPEEKSERLSVMMQARKLAWECLKVYRAELQRAATTGEAEQNVIGMMGAFLSADICIEEEMNS